MKVSELTTDFLVDYLKLDEPEESTIKEINACHAAAIAYAKSYTGLKEEDLDVHEDITTAIMIIIADMFENRNLYLDYKSKEINRTVETILGMYQVNLL